MNCKRLLLPPALGALILFTACQGREPSATLPAPHQTASVQACVNLNRASVEELKTLPGIGEVRARQIVEYRERRGGFRRPQEVILLDGFGEKRYRDIAALICVE